MSTVFMTKASL